MIGGGTVFNASPQESFFTVDLRTTDPALLETMTKAICDIAEKAAADEHVSYKKEMALENPAAVLEEQLSARRQHPIVQQASTFSVTC